MLGLPISIVSTADTGKIIPKDPSRADGSHNRQITSPHAMLLLEIRLPLLIPKKRFQQTSIRAKQG